MNRSETSILELDTGATKFARFVRGSKDTILTGSADGELVRWDARSGKSIQEIEIGTPLRSGELNHSSDVLTVVAADDTVQFYNDTDLALIKKYSVSP